MLIAIVLDRPLATRRRRCLLRSVWVNVMPERLLSVISGILAGGSRVSELSFVAAITSCLAPLCGSVFSWFCFFFGGHTHNDTQDVIVHVTLIAGSDPTSLCFVLFGLVWFGCGCGCFVCLVVFVFWFVFFVFLMGQLTGLRTGPLPVLLWLSTSRQPCMIITIHLFAAIERV